MHLQDDILLARIDEELDPQVNGRVARHLASCEACAGRMRDLRMSLRRIEVALSALDEESPLVEPPVRTIRELTVASAPRRFQRRTMAVAASLVFLLAAGAWAIPGSPIRAWLDAALDAGGGMTETTAISPAGPVDGATTADVDVDVSVEPRNGRVEVVLHRPALDTRLRLRVGDAPRASVRAADAEYRVSPGAIELDRVHGVIEVNLPATAFGRVLVDQTVVAEVRDGRLRVTAQAEGSGVVVQAG